jgi:hypothetical protein
LKAPALMDRLGWWAASVNILIIMIIHAY